jgi:transposase InsO family protein
MARHGDAGRQYVIFVFTAHLIGAGIDASIGTVGDALDNALMEFTIGLYKTELIKKDGPWRSLADVELATADYVDCYNQPRGLLYTPPCSPATTPTCSPRTTGNSPAPARPRDRGGSVRCIAAAMNRYSLGPL